MIQATNNHQSGAETSRATSGVLSRLAVNDRGLAHGPAVSASGSCFTSRRPLPCWPASAGSPPSASWQLGRGLGLDRFSFVRLSAFVAARPLQTLCPLDHLGCNRSDPAKNHSLHSVAVVSMDQRSQRDREACSPNRVTRLPR